MAPAIGQAPSRQYRQAELNPGPRRNGPRPELGSSCRGFFERLSGSRTGSSRTRRQQLGAGSDVQHSGIRSGPFRAFRYRRQFSYLFIGHSLGAAIVLQYAGVYPDRAKKVVAIEGIAPPPGIETPSPAHVRLRDWIEAMRDYEKRAPHHYPNLEAAYERMHKANPYLSKEMARHLTLFGSTGMRMEH